MLLFTQIFLICTMNLVQFMPIEARIGHFWHVTDFHLDNNYTVNGDPNEMCWLLGKSKVFSDKILLGTFGDYRCDAPIILIQSAAEAMKEIFPSPDFIVWTGDDTTHINDSFFSTDIVVDVISDVTAVLKNAFPNTLVLPVLGNHDFYPQNQAPTGENVLQTKVADLWKNWLDLYNGYSDFKQYGRFVADIPDSNVSFVAFNTLLWYTMNKITSDDPTAEDPADQFAWADEVIQNLENNGRKVYLMGHIPPGSFERYFDERDGFHWYQERYNRKYIDLINKHYTRISAQLYGHHHTDSFRVFLSERSTEEPISYLLIAPAVSPLRSSLTETAGANNPGIRLFAYDTETGKILEVSQYYLDLNIANVDGIAKWKLEYNLTDALNINEISPLSLYDAAKRLKEDSAFFDKYYPINTVQWEKDSSNCSALCRSTVICSVSAIDYGDYYECNKGFTSISSLVGISAAFVIFYNIWNRR